MKVLAITLSRSFRVAWLSIALTASVATNILLVGSQSFHSRVYEILSAAGLEGALAQGVLAQSRILIPEIERLSRKIAVLESQFETHNVKAKRATTTAKKMVARTAKNLALNVSSIMEEAVPYIGAGVVLAVTAADVKTGCDNIRDLNEMTKDLSDVESLQTVSEREVCGMKLPSAATVIDEIKRNLRGVISNSSKQARESAHTFYDDLGGSLHEIFNE